MMISPETYVHGLQNLPYEKLIKERDKLIKEIIYFEKYKSSNDERVYSDPSPEVVYQMNLEYLGKLCELIAEKYRFGMI